MSKRVPIGLAVIILVLSVAAGSFITYKVTYNKLNNLIADLPERTDTYSLLSETENIVKSNYYGLYEYSDLSKYTAAGLVQGLGDDSSCYLEASDVDSFKQYLSGISSGIGLNTVFDYSNSVLSVTSVVSSSDAAAKGLKAGMSVSAVNGVPVTADNYLELSDLLSSGYSGSIELTVSGENFSGTVIGINCGYSPESVIYGLKENTGYIRITSFYDNTPELFDAAVKALIAEKATSLIIDVRNNYSTNYDSAVKIIDMIVPLASKGREAVAVAENKDGKVYKVYSSDSASISLPVAVLINSGTQGCAELFAADVRDFGKGRLFGETTAGSGTLHEFFTLSNGDSLYLSVAQIYPCVSDTFNGCGVAPDEKIELSASEYYSLFSDNSVPSDTQFNLAYSYLNQ